MKTRFAPSPTGYMHIGNLRTALYSYLLAKANNGTFVLRIEDTDRNRYVQGSVDIIFETLKQSNIEYDEGPLKDQGNGPYFQSQRKDIYIKYAKELIDKNLAYYCFCEENIQNENNENLDSGYNRHCRNLSQEEINYNLKNNKPYVIRQKIPDNVIINYKDSVFGKISIKSDVLDDQVLIKRDGYPTYNFANVIDDHLMGITHIVRGSEYISSTPKYILLYQSFNWDIPTFIHLPIINGKDENGVISKLSKRHGSISFQDLINDGYLSDAIINYIMFLGWNPKNNKEIFSLAELKNIFDIKNLNKSPSVFDYKKLDWFNKQYIKKMNIQDFNNYIKKFLDENLYNFNIEKISENIKDKITTFNMINTELKFLYDMNFSYDKSLLYNEKYNINDKIIFDICNYTKEYLNNNVFNKVEFENLLRKYSEDNNIKFGCPMWILRILLSGKENTIIGPLEIIDLIGNIESIKRINFLINIVK